MAKPKMITVYPDRDERYPDWSLSRKGRASETSIQVSPEEWARYQRAVEEYEQIQTLIESRWIEAHNKPRKQT